MVLGEMGGGDWFTTPCDCIDRGQLLTSASDPVQFDVDNINRRAFEVGWWVE